MKLYEIYDDTQCPCCGSPLARPSCFPGDYPAVTPRSVTAVAGGSLRALYVHAACGTAWVTCWDRTACAWDELTGRRAS